MGAETMILELSKKLHQMYILYCFSLTLYLNMVMHFDRFFANKKNLILSPTKKQAERLSSGFVFLKKLSNSTLLQSFSSTDTKLTTISLITQEP